MNIGSSALVIAWLKLLVNGKLNEKCFKKVNIFLGDVQMLKLVFGLLTSIQSCGDGRATLVGMESTPAFPKAGDNTTLWIAYDLPEPAVTGGTATYSVTLNGLPLNPTTEDLCTQTKCPIEAGVHNESSWSLFPSGITGTIVSKIDWTDEHNERIWCVQTKWKL
jgi:hypothetical protein